MSSLRLSLGERSDGHRDAVLYTVTQATLYCTDNGTTVSIGEAIDVPARRGAGCAININRITGGGETYLESPGCALGAVGTTCPFLAAGASPPLLVTITAQLPYDLISGQSYTVSASAATSRAPIPVGSIIAVTGIQVQVGDGGFAVPALSLLNVIFDASTESVTLLFEATGPFTAADTRLTVRVPAGGTLKDELLSNLAPATNGRSVQVTIPNPGGAPGALAVEIVEHAGTSGLPRITYEVAAPGGGPVAMPAPADQSLIPAEQALIDAFFTAAGVPAPAVTSSRARYSALALAGTPMPTPVATPVVTPVPTPVPTMHCSLHFDLSELCRKRWWVWISYSVCGGYTVGRSVSKDYPMTTPVSQACAELKQEAITDFTTSVPVPPGTSAPFGSKCMDTSISWSGLTNYYQVSGWCTSVPSFSNSNNGCGCSYNSANGSPPN